MAAYARLARLPPPRPRRSTSGSLLRAGREPRDAAAGRGRCPARPSTVQADADQLEQLLINLVRNAADAALETRGGVALGWKRGARARSRSGSTTTGPACPTTANLFVPFFTTKPGGSGIGLVLSRQIAEAHGGSLSLENRRGHHGSIARLRLPLGAAA